MAYDRMGIWYCDCGANTGHTSEDMCAKNRQATGVYMAAMSDGAGRGADAMIRRASVLSTVRVLPDGSAVVDGDPTWDVAIGTQYDPSIIAIRSRNYRETSCGEVIFIRATDPRYAELADYAVRETVG